MQQSYIVSNKENDYVGDRSPYRLKMNYQERQKYYDRSKSPLAESNHKFNFRDNKESGMTPLTSKKRDFSFKYADQTVHYQLAGQRYDENSMAINDNRESNHDLSVIKPISLENKKNHENYENRTIQKESFQENHLQNDYRTYSKSAHRENSKHLGFIAKVGNLEKINHQITSLLNYVNENKITKKEPQNDESSVSSKPKYGMIADNSKSYQRRLNGLERPKGPQPFISIFEPENNQKLVTPSNKSQLNRDLTNKIFQNDSSKTNFKQNRNRTPKPAIKKDLSPKNVERPKLLQNNLNISPLRTVRSQQFNQMMTPSDSQQNLSKITTGNNPDLEFYYESLKKRDQQIQMFQKNLHQESSINTDIFINQNQNRNLKSNPNSIRTEFTKQKGFENKKKEEPKKLAVKEEAKIPEKKFFVTEQEVQNYKEINWVQKSQNGRVSAKKRIQNLRAEINRSENSKFEDVVQDLFTKRKQRSMIKNDIFKANDIKDDDSFNLRTQKLKIQPDFCAKIQDQMKKIQDQMNDCEKEKNVLRGKYSNLLPKQRSQKHQKPDNSNPRPNECPIQTKANTFIDQIMEDKDRMYDSSHKKMMMFNLEKDDQFHRDLRRRMVANHQQTINNENYRNDSQVYDKSFGQRNLSNQKLVRPSLRNQTDRSFNKGMDQKIDESKSYGIDESSKDRLSQMQNLKTPTNSSLDKKFQIMLHKVEVTKPQTTKLGGLLAEKIELDMKLREQREKFSNNKNPNKWQELRQHLSIRYGMSKTAKQWEELLSISPQEHNPFSPTQATTKPLNNINQQLELQRDGSTEQDILLLASLLAESLNYFDSQLLHNFSEKKLQKEHFSFRELDLSSKGYLSLEDLVCFINLHSGKFYRNRDAIFLIKSMNLFHRDLCEGNSSASSGVQAYSSQKGSTGYRISQKFLWRVFTDKK